jgi:squalene synthase HpnD
MDFVHVRVDVAGGGVAEAYRHCENVTHLEARNFSYGIRLLPPVKRRALSAVYAFARRIDDIGDGPLPAQVKLSRLEQARAEIADPAAHPDDPVLVALADASRRLPIPLAAFGELIDGCAMDVRGTTYRTFDELHQYCRCVAGSIGRLSAGVFEPHGPDAPEHADALGVALQLTNILRDVREDRLAGRIYLPEEDLAAHGVELSVDADGRLDAPADAFTRLIRFEADRAERWYRRGLRLLPLLDRRSAACTAAMAGIYHRLLRRIAADPDSIRGRRVCLPPAQKALVAGVALLGGRP